MVETSNGVFEHTDKHKHLTSKNGKARSPMRTILCDAWTDAERRKYNVYPVVEFEFREGYGPKKGFSDPTYSKDKNKIYQTYETEKIVRTTEKRISMEDPRVILEGIIKRIEAIETILEI